MSFIFRVQYCKLTLLVYKFETVPATRVSLIGLPITQTA